MSLGCFGGPSRSRCFCRSFSAFLRAFHSVWHILLACQAGQWAGLIHQTLLKGLLWTKTQKEQNIRPEIIHRFLFFCIHKLPPMYFCVKNWLQCKYMQGKCGVRFCIWTLCRTSSGKQSLNRKLQRQMRTRRIYLISIKKRHWGIRRGLQLRSSNAIPLSWCLGPYLCKVFLAGTSACLAEAAACVWERLSNTFQILCKYVRKGRILRTQWIKHNWSACNRNQETVHLHQL